MRTTRPNPAAVTFKLDQLVLLAFIGVDLNRILPKWPSSCIHALDHNPQTCMDPPFFYGNYSYKFHFNLDIYRFALHMNFVAFGGQLCSDVSTLLLNLKFNR